MAREMDETLARMRALLRDAPAPGPFSRDLFQPGHFTASAFVLSPDEKDLLLILHRRLGLWLQPGGHVEDCDETLLAAATREVAEETGVAGAVVLERAFDLDIHSIPATSSAPGHLHFDVRAVFRASSLQIERTSEVSDARWFSLEAIAGSTSELTPGLHTDDSVRRAAARLIRRSRKGP